MSHINKKKCGDLSFKQEVTRYFIWRTYTTILHSVHMHIHSQYIAHKTRMTAINSQQLEARKNLFYKYI